MEAMAVIGIIIGGIIALIMIYIFGMFFLGFMRWCYLLFPFPFGIGIGLEVWSSGYKIIGNIIVIASIVWSILWVRHLWGNYECNCLIHWPHNLMDKIYDKLYG